MADPPCSHNPDPDFNIKEFFGPCLNKDYTTILNVVRSGYKSKCGYIVFFRVHTDYPNILTQADFENRLRVNRPQGMSVKSIQPILDGKKNVALEKKIWQVTYVVDNCEFQHEEDFRSLDVICPLESIEKQISQIKIEFVENKSEKINSEDLMFLSNLLNE